MITVTIIEIDDGRRLKRTASDTHYIQKVGTDEIYAEAVDVLDAPYQYEETNIPLLVEEGGET